MEKMVSLKQFVKKRTVFWVISILVIIFMLVLGPMDIFSHGFYCDTVSYENIYEEDRLGTYSLLEGAYKTSFTPLKQHFTGFAVNLANVPKESAGELCLTTYLKNGREIETIVIDLNEVTDRQWYMVYASGKYKPNVEYDLTISTKNCETAPFLQFVDNDYLTYEGMGNNLLMGYAYAKSTFTFVEKVLICLFIFGIWFFLLGEAGIVEEKKMRTRMVSLVVLLTTVFAWNYMYSSFNQESRAVFVTYEAGSEALVTGPIKAEKSGVSFEKRKESAKGGSYGLGRYTDVLGPMYSHDAKPLNDATWDYGYHRTEAQIVVSSNEYTREAAAVGNTIQFANGDVIGIIDVLENGNSLIITLDSSKALLKSKYGELSEMVFCGAKPFKSGTLTAYESQYGLQGKVFRHFARCMSKEAYLANLNLLCSLAAAGVFVAIILLIAKKYNKLMAGCFGVTFALSPWIVNFARNLYWVEFTWFLPMLIGLVCSIWIKKRSVRVACYFAALIAITGKCLCGYEYLPVVMLGMIAFLVSDWIMALVQRDKENAALLFRTIFLIGLSAVIGFAVAICIHARLRGEGNVLEGVESIIEQDVLRRVGGGSLNDFDVVLWDSLNASVWTVFSRYFHFGTEVITGIDGKLFPVLCVAPIAIFIYDYSKKKLEIQNLVMYVVLFITSIAWYVLGKSHSYIHVHLNFVMWYFGYVQICLYVILKKFVDWMKNRKQEGK